MQVTFWGVRGSIATSGAEFARFGGNTTCVEVTSGTHRLILDAGTGLRGLGQKILAESRALGAPVAATFLFSHLHWDHIQGFPFFGPLFLPSTSLQLYGPRDEDGSDIEAALTRQMQPPHFPVPLGVTAAEKRFATVEAGDVLEIGPFRVEARGLCHPQGTLGYRIEAEGRVLCFATDTEHHLGEALDEHLLVLARDADLVIHDAQYTEAQYAGRDGPARKGWGHSTYLTAVAAARAAGARRLALFHHDPGHGDDLVEAIERDARDHFLGAFAAREGAVIDV